MQVAAFAVDPVPHRVEAIDRLVVIGLGELDADRDVGQQDVREVRRGAGVAGSKFKACSFLAPLACAAVRTSFGPGERMLHWRVTKYAYSEHALSGVPSLVKHL